MFKRGVTPVSEYRHNQRMNLGHARCIDRTPGLKTVSVANRVNDRNHVHSIYK